MKISNPADIKQSELLRSTQAAASRQAGSAGGAAIEKAGAAASVQLSETSRNLAAETAAGEPIRTAKVDEVRKAISEGRFHVNADVVADKMIAEAAELLETLSRPR
ncbi:MAG TPA: flagellar biosynthesis anti-sigma factor FlgM [Burkholderiaceae bacterium]|nr:flagellar biosynthesis anti-sigma factor FlgM [Burkholderiaceae bacterium]